MAYLTRIVSFLGQEAKRKTLITMSLLEQADSHLISEHCGLSALTEAVSGAPNGAARVARR